MPKYEAAIFNQKVRDALRKGQRNETGLDDEWENVRYIEVMASNEEDAWARLRRRYLENTGFVIKDLRQTS